MATAERYITAQSGAVRLALRDLDTLWSRTQAWDPLARRQLLEEAWPLLIERYGEITATLAADRFEEVTGMPAVLADSVNIEQANARMRWGLEPLFGGAGDGAALGRLAQIADELVKQPGRDTLIQSAARNGIRYARVPSGKRTCAFCLMLASRGAVYANKGSAGNARKFHGDCDCRIEPVADEGDLRRLKRDGYDPGELRDIYDASKATRDGAVDAKATLANIRAEEGTH